MMDDLLDQATKALREEGEPSDEELARLRARLESSVQKSNVRRLHVARWVLPMAATFVAASALAAVPSVREAVVEAVAGFVERVSGPPAPKPAPRAARPPVPATPVEPPSEAPALVPEVAPPDAALEPPPELHEPAKRRSRREPRLTPAPPEPSPSEPATHDADLEAYKTAHVHHFTERKYDLALRAWDDYLARFPNGRFAVEAQYNRALCLVRLKRHDEARRALEPFAAGAVEHGYRQREAKQLLEALSARP